MVDGRRIMKSLCAIAILAASVVVALPAVSMAQPRGTTTQGAFGTTSLGNPSGTSAPAFGTGMTTGMGSNNAQGGNTQGGNTQAGTVFESGLVGGMQQLQRGGQSGFVGLSGATAQNPFATGQAVRGTQNFGMLTQLLAQSQRNQFNQQQAQRGQRGGAQNQSQFRVPMRLGFQPLVISPTRIAPFARRLEKMESISKVGPIEATLEGRTAVLRGMVASEADRQLAEGLAMLEPEVQGVRNELVVATRGTTGGAPLPLTP
jgi:BON domain